MDSVFSNPEIYKNNILEDDKSKCNTQRNMDDSSNIVHKLFNREVSFISWNSQWCECYMLSVIFTLVLFIVRLFGEFTQYIFSILITILEPC